MRVGEDLFLFLQAALVALGFGKENASAVIKALEKEAGVKVKARGASLSTKPCNLPVSQKRSPTTSRL